MATPHFSSRPVAPQLPNPSSAGTIFRPSAGEHTLVVLLPSSCPLIVLTLGPHQSHHSSFLKIQTILNQLPLSFPLFSENISSVSSPLSLPPSSSPLLLAAFLGAWHLQPPKSIQVKVDKG